METMRRNKINDLYEFPQRLNMFPYTKEGLAQKEKPVCACVRVCVYAFCVIV